MKIVNHKGFSFVISDNTQEVQPAQLSTSLRCFSLQVYLHKGISSPFIKQRVRFHSLLGDS